MLKLDKIWNEGCCGGTSVLVIVQTLGPATKDSAPLLFFLHVPPDCREEVIIY